MQPKLYPLLFLIVGLMIVACSTTKHSPQAPNSHIGKLVFLHAYDVAYNEQWQGTTVGGLSGIDYNADKDEYYLVSDDRSALNPARFYTAKIQVKNNRIDTVMFTAVTPFLQASGQTYPPSNQNTNVTPDPESIRFNKATGNFVWTSEGERTITAGKVVLINPAITTITAGGSFVDTFALPPQLKMSTLEKGPRQNGVLEGLTFANNFATLYVSVEEPLYEDGPQAGLQDNKALTRIIKYEVATHKPVAQYAYKLAPVAYPPNPAGAFTINGITEILSAGKDKLLVVERSFSTGRLACTIRVFEADLSRASNVINNPSMLATPPTNLVAKNLLVNMDTLGFYIDNVEGLTYGPVLANGHKTIVFVSDNNFAAAQKTQLLLFEVLP